MNIIHKLILANYIDCRYKEHLPDSALSRARNWVAMNLMLWYFSFETILRYFFNIKWGLWYLVHDLYVASDLFLFVVCIILFYMPLYLFTNSYEKYEQQYRNDDLKYVEAWKYIYLPVIIPFGILLYFNL